MGQHLITRQKKNTYAKNLDKGLEPWRLTENNKRRVEATETDALRRSSRI